MRQVQDHKGITLVEIMAALVIGGIITVMALPEFSLAINRLKFKTTARDIVSTMRLARSTAITSKQPVGVNFGNDDMTLTTFVDTDDPVAATFAESDSVITVDTLPADFIYLWPLFANTAVIYEPNGTASQTGAVYFLAWDANSEYLNIGAIDVLASTGRTKLTGISCY